MSEIKLLSQDTIDQIAAGEVVERPASVVKELIENAIDAGADALTVEIRDGGISLIRVTDNGCGIQKREVRAAFLRHATSKIQTVDDLSSAATLGFRGEALSSIAAVSRTEMITKTPDEMLGTRYVIEGGTEQSLTDVGAPDGTTILVRSLFYNTPARRKFLKTAATEAGAVSDLTERLALSHPDISFQLIRNQDTKLFTSGNGSVADIIYSVYGREIAADLLPVDCGSAPVYISGFIGKPAISRGNRNFENFFVNGRYIRNAVISRAIEDAYQPFLMNHRFPFTVLFLTIDAGFVDVNVHPAKMEVRFSDQNLIYERVYQAVKSNLTKRELIPEVTVESAREEQRAQETKKEQIRYPEPFEKTRQETFSERKSPYESEEKDVIPASHPAEGKKTLKPVTGVLPQPQQMDLFDEKFLSKENISRHKLIGQVFDTYWIVQFEDNLYIIDQHAAHEKVLYERFMEKYRTKQHTSQMITPPMIVSLSMQEEEQLERHWESFTEIGFQIEPFGGKEYAISAVPGDLYGIADAALFSEILDGLTGVSERADDEAVREKIATMSCKAAVKGNQALSAREADALIGELLSLENPYNCPHGRPTIISMSKYELEKKFKRVV